MSIQAMVWVLEHSEAEHSARLVLLSLANHASSDESEAWPSVALIAREARLGESTVRQALEQLKALGEIVEIGLGPRRTRAFRLPLDPAESAPPQNLHPPADSGPLGVQDLAPDPAESAPEPLKEPSEEPDPQTPASGGQVGEGDLPVPPTSKRKRDRDEFREQCVAWAARHLPDLGEAGGEAVEQAIQAGATTPAAVIKFVDRWWRRK